MQILNGKVRERFLSQYSIQSFFSFDITPFVHVCRFEKGEFIFQEGSYPEYVYYMVEGKAKLYVTHKNGKVSLIDFLSSPAFMGEIELLMEERYSKGIQAVSQTTCFAISVQKCKEKLLSDAVFLKMLCVYLGNKTHERTAKFTRTQAYPLENRLATFIQISSDNNFYKEKHTEVCEYLGVSYRHLLYVFAQLCEQGILEKSGRGYQIVDLKKLQALASDMQ